jgi:hypothetical protein
VTGPLRETRPNTREVASDEDGQGNTRALSCGQFSSQRRAGLRLFFAGPPTACACRREVRHQPIESGIFLLHLAQPAELSRAQMRILLFPGVGGRFAAAELPAEITNRGTTLSLPDGLDGRSALRRIVTASSIHSFRKGPSKPPFYSRFKLPSFSGETSQRHRKTGLSGAEVTNPRCYSETLVGTQRFGQ